MERIQRILIPLSLTPADANLLRYARLLAERGLARQFHFVHVHLPGTSGAVGTSEETIAQRLASCAADALGQDQRYVATTRLLTGARIDAILQEATLQRSDLILLGHRRVRSGQRSLARRLAMVAPCSVWLVPEGAPVALSRILAPVDFSDHSADSLRVATSLAAAAGISEVKAIHVFFSESPPRYDETVEELRVDEAGAFQRFLRQVPTSGTRVEPICIESGDPAKAILRVAHDHQSDLLVMSTRGRSRAAAILLGSITAQVMTETPIAILVVKHFGAMMGLFQTLRESHFWSRSNPKAN